MKTTTKRTFDVLDAATPSPRVKERLGELGANLDRLLLHNQRTLIVNEAIHKLINVLYIEGATVNVDLATWRILIALPWGSAGWRQWSLRQWEARALRLLIDNRVKWHRKTDSAPLFLYENRIWVLNLGDYPSIEAAQEYAKNYPIGWREWKFFADQIAAQRHVTR